ncbi:MAG: hypothetical protein ACJA04_000752, partial [Cellvibrionaceae bacterium]
MHTQSIEELCQKVEKLIHRCEQLQQENTNLLNREKQWK